MFIFNIKISNLFTKYIKRIKICRFTDKSVDMAAKYMHIIYYVTCRYKITWYLPIHVDKTFIIYSRFARYYFVIIQLYAAFVGLYMYVYSMSIFSYIVS